MCLKTKVLKWMGRETCRPDRVACVCPCDLYGMLISLDFFSHRNSVLQGLTRFYDKVSKYLNFFLPLLKT